MNPENFKNTVFGGPEREPGNKYAYWYYMPKPVPRNVPITAETVMLLSQADAALGQLQAFGYLIRNPDLLIRPYAAREAVASTRIEGTQASLSEVLQAEASDNPRTDDVKEVLAYVRASKTAFELIKELPLSQRLILRLHKEILSGVRGEEKFPGEFRRSQVWVGKYGASLENAIFVPPPNTRVSDLISDWEKYVNERGLVPPLVQCALMHYQFETIHPFVDGNGRLGRLLINVLLHELGLLTVPLLYLSGFFESNRDEYYARLQAVRERGEIQEWLQFFLGAVAQQSRDGINRSKKLISIREKYLEEASKTRSRLPILVDAICTNPYVTVSVIKEKTGLTNPGARGVINTAVYKGWLTPVSESRKGVKDLWVATEINQVLEAENVD